MSLVGLVHLVARRDVVGTAAATQVVANGATRQSLESHVATLQWGPLKDLKEKKVTKPHRIVNTKGTVLTLLLVLTSHV